MKAISLRADVADLQEQIRRAARITRALRTAGICAFVFGMGGALVAGAAVLPWMVTSPENDGPLLAVQAWLLGHGNALTLLALAGVPAALVPALVHRRLRRAQLRRRLAPLSDADRAAVLGPLRSEDRDTRSLVLPLLNERAASAELVPAPALAGRGDEVAAGQ